MWSLTDRLSQHGRVVAVPDSLIDCAQVSQTITPWAIRRLVIGGCLYTGGLVPWACNFVEFHNAIWHVCVLAASAVFYSVVYHELALPPAACAGLL